jgi:hypothetical protein
VVAQRCSPWEVHVRRSSWEVHLQQPCVPRVEAEFLKSLRPKYVLLYTASAFSVNEGRIGRAVLYLLLFLFTLLYIGRISSGMLERQHLSREGWTCWPGTNSQNSMSEIFSV